jgi:ribonuclease HII
MTRGDMARIIPDFSFEKEYLQAHGNALLVGVDEAGRGPLAGPVVAAAARYKDLGFGIPVGLEKEFDLIRDSKALSEKQREKVFDTIHGYFDVGIGIIHPETIDRINILEATFLAMKEAVAALQRRLRECRPELVSGPQDNEGMPKPASTELQRGERVRHDNESVLLLIDGNQKIPNLSLFQQTVVGGDKLVKTIAAASIVAKVTRDRMMDGYDKEYPRYGFAKHKGYGTRQHMEALEKHGPTPVHRTSFAPVSQAIIRFKELGILS